MGDEALQGGKKTDAETLAEQRPFVETRAPGLVLDPHSADDVVHESLLAAMKSPPQRSVRDWLARVARLGYAAQLDRQHAFRPSLSRSPLRVLRFVRIAIQPRIRPATVRQKHAAHTAGPAAFLCDARRCRWRER